MHDHAPDPQEARAEAFETEPTLDPGYECRLDDFARDIQPATGRQPHDLGGHLLRLGNSRSVSVRGRLDHVLDQLPLG